MLSKEAKVNSFRRKPWVVMMMMMMMMMMMIRTTAIRSLIEKTIVRTTLMMIER